MKRVFLVEDDPNICELLTCWIEDFTDADVAGTASTESGARAWMAANGQSWDIAVVDLNLHEGTGMGLMEGINKTGDQKVVVLTAYVTARMRDCCTRAGADAVFDKSTDFGEFTDFLAETSAGNRA
jgi:DNA-binding NarL/FixJ family response regulator